MLKGLYQSMIRTLAGKSINARPTVPGAETGLFDSEVMRPIGKRINAGPVPQRAQIPQVKTSDDTIHLGVGPQIDPAKFPVDFYMGEEWGVYN